jgi:hypothetical protein
MALSFLELILGGNLDLVRRVYTEHHNSKEHDMYMLFTNFDCFHLEGDEVPAMFHIGLKIQKTRNHGYSFTDTAAANGRLDILRWLVEEGFQSDPITLCHALRAKYLHIVDYLLDLGIPWPEQIIYRRCEYTSPLDIALKTGSERVVRYVLERCPSEKWATSQIYNIYTIEIAYLLLEKKVLSPLKLLCQCIMYNKVNVLRWAARMNLFSQLTPGEQELIDRSLAGTTVRHRTRSVYYRECISSKRS